MSVRVGEYGLQLQITTTLLLTGATAANLYVKRPSLPPATVDVGTEVIAATGTATFTYVTLLADPFTTEAGRVLLELEVDFGAAKRLRSPVGVLAVVESVSRL